MKNLIRLERNNFDNLKIIYNEFAKTKFGKDLKKEVRYGRFKPKSVSRKLWQEVLGPDVNNLEHHLVTCDIANDFFIYNDKKTTKELIFNYQERKLLIIAALIHDWGESIVGDVTFDRKSVVYEKKEHEAFKSILEKISLRNNSSVNFSDIEEAFEKVVRGKEKKLAEAFHAIERMGYLLTGVRAWRKGKLFLQKNVKFSQGLWWLANNVALNQTKKLIGYGEIYPAVSYYLDKNRKWIDEIFSKMPDEIFSKYEQEESVERKKQFNEAKRVWMESRDRINY
jgi:5'-deoxynucleotidase YfbR-like HD superfamily hydrolase